MVTSNCFKLAICVPEPEYLVRNQLRFEKHLTYIARALIRRRESISSLTFWGHLLIQQLLFSCLLMWKQISSATKSVFSQSVIFEAFFRDNSISYSFRLEAMMLVFINWWNFITDIIFGGFFFKVSIRPQTSRIIYTWPLVCKIEINTEKRAWILSFCVPQQWDKCITFGYSGSACCWHRSSSMMDRNMPSNFHFSGSLKSK